ncbi:MAG: class II aldolase/adducin family protein [Elusimicrobiota bacterium]
MSAPRPVERELREEIVRYCRRLSEKDYAPGTSGNISVRLDAKRFLITPTGMGKWQIEPRDLLVIDRQGRRLQGGRKPTSEVKMHLALLGSRPEMEAVVHAHPATATGFACAGIPLNQPLVAEFVEALGCAPLAPFGTPGTSELVDSLKDLARDNDAILLANHGVVTMGKCLYDAYAKMELVEHCAKITLTARQLGREQKLKESDVQKLLEARAHYFGLDETPARRSDCPTPGLEYGAACPKSRGKDVDPKTLERVIKDVLRKL